jgi:hypothetical protein
MKDANDRDAVVRPSKVHHMPLDIAAVIFEVTAAVEHPNQSIRAFSMRAAFDFSSCTDSAPS